MKERRRHPRDKRRLMVKYGDRDLSHTGYTFDVSRSGIFIISSHRPRLNTQVHVQLYLTPDHYVCLEATVCRQIAVAPPEMLPAAAKGGFAVRFLHLDEILAEFPESLNVLQVRYRTVEELRQAYDREIRFGTLFVPTRSELPPDAQVVLTLQLDFANRNYDVPGKVVHIGRDTSRGSSRGASVVFNEVKKIKDMIRPLLGG